MARSDDYCTWEELLADDPLAPKDTAGEPLPTGDGPPAVEMSPHMRSLLAERERLELHLRALTGDAPVDPEDARREAMYPVPKHTKDTRIEWRRVERMDAENRQALQRSLERIERERRRTAEERQAEEDARRRQVAELAARRKAELRAVGIEEEQQGALQRRVAAARVIAEKQRVADMHMHRDLAAQRERDAREALPAKDHGDTRDSGRMDERDARREHAASDILRNRRAADKAAEPVLDTRRPAPHEPARTTSPTREGQRRNGYAPDARREAQRDARRTTRRNKNDE